MGLYDELGDMEEILDDFVIETNELVEQLNQDILLVEESSDPDTINRIFRAFHTIKGTSGFLSFDFCMDLAHASEDLLNKLRSGDMQPSPEIVDILLDSTDWFKMFIHDVDERVEREYDTSKLQEKIQGLIQDEQGTPGTSEGGLETEDHIDLAELHLPEGFPDELVKEFFSEAHEMIETVGNELMSMEIEPDNEDIINEVFRVFHTLKGNSALVGLEQMSLLAHRSEDVLGLVREGKVEVESPVVDALLGVVDYMREVLEEVQNEKLVTHDTSFIHAQLDAILGEQDNDPQPEVVTAIKDDVGADSTGSGETNPSKKPAQETQSKPDSPKGKTQSIDHTIRVDVDRMEQLMNVAGELVLEKNRLLEISNRVRSEYPEFNQFSDLESLNTSLGYITTEIQESVMQMRMLPINNVFRKFPRMVRDLARENDKQIELNVTGHEIELDRTLIEGIGDPLIHLLRNAIDHGIESADARVALGKPEAGHIELSAKQTGEHIEIVISDDGRGLDAQAIRDKAIERGLLDESTADELSEEALFSYIFKPGFSTAKVVSDISGRGVGLDVVNNNISKLNGTVKLSSEANLGTSLVIKLPLTLTIMNGMVVRIGNEIYIIPLINIDETLKLEPHDVENLEDGPVLQLRDEKMPLYDLSDLFKADTIEKDQQKYVVIAHSGEERIALIVSELLGQEETVVKPLGEILGRVPYLGGASLRGDGRVALIIDTSQITSRPWMAEGVLT